MKANERRLLMLFLLLAVVLGGAVGVQQLRAWQHRLERRERDVQLSQLEAVTLLTEAPMWKAKGTWLSQALPVATSEKDANEALFDMVQNTAKAAGLDIKGSILETVEKKDTYQQFSVTITVKGDLTSVMNWIYERQKDPGAFYVVPQLHITQDKEDTKVVNAKVRIMRWYAPDTQVAVAKTPEETPTNQPE